MSAVEWPTHKARAAARRKSHAAAKRRRKRLRRLYKTGKRGVVTYRGGSI